MSFPARMLGITVMPEYLQTEGAEAVLDNLQHRAGDLPAVLPAGAAQRDLPQLRLT